MSVALSSALAFIVAIFAVSIGPHLVHHLFDGAEHGHPVPCLYAAAAERCDAVASVVAVVISVAPPWTPLPAEARGAAPSAAPVHVSARAPPRLLA